MRNLFAGVMAMACVLNLSAPINAEIHQNHEYTIGVDDVLDIAVLSPEKLLNTVTVSPDGSITFPYIGNVRVKDLTLAKAQDLIQARLADGYMKYPSVSVSLKESRSRKFSISGDVLKPGTYTLDENTTILKAISTAGGYVRAGHSNTVEIVRQKKNGAGYKTIKVNIKDVKSGDSSQNLLIQEEDAIEVTEKKFSVYGEVVKPGTYPLEDNTTILKAISTAEGFTKFGSSSRVKILRPKTDETGYENIKVNIGAVMDGSSKDDILLKAGDIVVVSKGMF